MRKENNIWQEQQEYIHVMKTSFRLTKPQPKARHLMSILQTARLLALPLTTILKSGHHG